MLKNFGLYYVYGIDTCPINVYNVVGITTPEGEFITWKETLIKILNFLKFSDIFLANFNQDNDIILDSAIKEFDKIPTNLNDSWNKQDITYDAIIGKKTNDISGWAKKYQENTYVLVND